MGTHPIFESDFDCLTDSCFKMRLTQVNRFRALTATAKKTPAVVKELTRADLPTMSTVRKQPFAEGPSSVLVKVKYSNINFKDALAMTGNYAGMQFPMVGGVDISGTVISDESGKFKAGQDIVVNGFGIGTDHFGGYAEEARLRSEWCQLLPEGMSHLTAARIGTAGYTAALCVEALVEKGLKPADGKVVVSGATGGVGSVAVMLLSQMGFEVVALSGKAEAEGDFLKSIGATEVLARQSFEEKARALNKELYAGAVDVAGGNILANILSMTQKYGCVSCCGLANSMNLPTTVAPFILRGITLFGIECVYLPIDRRVKAYQLLSNHMDPAKMDQIGSNAIVGLEAVPDICQAMLKGDIKGRYVVDPTL